MCSNMLIAGGVLVVIVVAWFLVYYWLNPHLEKADGKACVTGRCGDTMEIRLTFAGNRVAETSYQTNGCVYSLNCVCAAADLAKGKTPDEILAIDADLIQASMGGLPRDHMDCASLAAETLQAALDDYMRNRGSHQAHG